MAEEATSTEIIELFAFELYTAAWRELEDNRENDKALSMEDTYQVTMHEWREKPALREQWRNAATDLMTYLEQHGLPFKVRKPQLIRARLDEIITIPARKAYEL